MASKTYPLNFRQVLRDFIAGEQAKGFLTDVDVDCRLMWEIKGPPHTEIAWLSCYAVQQSLVIVETFKESGWGVFIEPRVARIDETLGLVLSMTRKVPS